MTTELLARYGTVARSKQNLVKDLKGVVDDADQLLKDVANSTSDEFAGALTTVEARLGEARSRLDDARSVVTQQVRHAAGLTQEYVSDNPWKLIGFAAAAAGLLTAFLFSRRGD